MSLLFSVVLLSLLSWSSANVYHGGQVIVGAPLYYGREPFKLFGNVTGLLTVGNATNANGNIVLCPTFVSPVEDLLLWCIQQRPAGLISVAPNGKNRLEYLGKTMYTIGRPSYDPLLESLREIPIVEINFDDFVLLSAVLASSPLSHRITIDGGTKNPFIEAREGGWTTWYQVSSSLAAFFVAIVAILNLRTWWLRGRELGWNVKTNVTVINLLISLFRGLYCAIDPTGTRRLITAQNDLLFTTINLIGLVASSTTCSLYWLETVIDKSLKIHDFISNPWTIATSAFLNGIWVVLLVIWRVMAEFPEVSPLSTGSSLFALILIQVILLGLTAVVCSIISVILLIKITQAMKKTGSRESLSRKIYRAAYLGLKSMALLSLFAVTVTALTSKWNNPWIAQVLQWWCYFPAHPLVQGFQVLSFTTQSSTPSSRTSRNTSSKSAKTPRTLSVSLTPHDSTGTTSSSLAVSTSV